MTSLTPDTYIRFFMHGCPQSINASGCPSPGAKESSCIHLVPLLGLARSNFNLCKGVHEVSPSSSEFHLICFFLNVKHEFFKLEATNHSGLSQKNGIAPIWNFSSDFDHPSWTFSSPTSIKCLALDCLPNDKML